MALEQIADYIAAGAVAVGLGGPLIGDALDGGSLSALRERARAALEAVRTGRERPMSGGLVTLGETMGLVVQGLPGSLRNGEAMSFGMGGSESNVAIGVRRLGMPATWIGRVGDDPPGHLILRELRAERVRTITVTDPAPTGLMVRWRPSGAHGAGDVLSPRERRRPSPGG